VKIKRGSTSVRRLIFIGDSSSTTGAGLPNLTSASAGLNCWYYAGDLANDVQMPLVPATLGSFTPGGFVAVDNTNLPGWYELGIENAALDGGNEVAIMLKGAANMVPVNIYIELDSVNYQDAAAFGLSKFADIETDTQNIQSRLPTALSGGRMDSSVGAYQSSLAPLQPTVAGRTLGVGTAGEIEIVNLVEELAASALVANDTVDTITQNVLQGQINPNAVAGSLAKYIQIIKRANTVVEGTVTAATTPTTTSFSTNLTYPTQAFAHSVLMFDSGLVIDQNSPILTYNNTNGQITLEEALTSAPVVGNTFIIIPASHVHSIAGIVAGLMGQAGSTSTYDAGDLGYLVAQLYSMIQADGSGGWQWEASSLILAPSGGGGGGTGTGARTVNITVQLSGAPVQGAKVRLTKAGETYLGTTNVSGVATFNIDDGSWIVSITSPNTTFAGAVLAVSGTVNQTYSVTAIAITPSSPGNVTGYWLVLGANGLPETGVTMSMQAVSTEHGSTGLAIDTATRTAVSDAVGVAQFSDLTPGVRYQAWRGTGAKVYVTIPADSDPIVELNSLLGSP
jgi:hypothetical protein